MQKPIHKTGRRLYLAPDGTIIYLASNEPSGDEPRLYIGKGEEVRQIPILHVSRFICDGITLQVRTTAEILFSPGPDLFSACPNLANLPAQWGTQRLRSLDPEDLLIMDQFTISLK